MANNKPASAYVKPHTMSGSSNINTKMTDPNTLSANDMKIKSAPRVSMGDPGRDDVKTTGIQVRGGKAQTKGKMARGPMA